MTIGSDDLKRIYEKNKSTHIARLEDWFPALYLSQRFQCEISDIQHQVAFGNSDYGIDAFYYDEKKMNLYLYQFKWSQDHNLFKESIERLINAGMERVFGNVAQDRNENQMLRHLRETIIENRSVINQILFIFIFNGDPDKCERSARLESLREDLESKKYLIDQYFGDRKVDLVIQYVSNQTKELAGQAHLRKTHSYPVDIEHQFNIDTEKGEKLFVGLVPLIEINNIYQSMGVRFFDRNIRAGLSEMQAPNRAIKKTLKDLVIHELGDPDSFVFNHNGITVAVEAIRHVGEGKLVLTEPRLLNGAQTITTFNRFISDHADHPSFKKNRLRLEKIRVLAKILVDASDEFVANVTICNNRQNPVSPLNLRANDRTQMDYQDKFREDLGLYYERQENAFHGLTYEDLEVQGYSSSSKAVELKRLALTLLALQGQVDKMSRLPEVFESEKSYKDTFRDSYLRSDFRRIILLYKIQYRINLLLKKVCAPSNTMKPDECVYLRKTKNLLWSLLCQAVLNDRHLDQMLERYGTSLNMETGYQEFLADLVDKKVRRLIHKALEPHHEKLRWAEDLSIIRNKSTYDDCLSMASSKYAWQKRGL
jgi:hypothetical protein